MQSNGNLEQTRVWGHSGVWGQTGFGANKGLGSNRGLGSRGFGPNRGLRSNEVLGSNGGFAFASVISAFRVSDIGIYCFTLNETVPLNLSKEGIIRRLFQMLLQHSFVALYCVIAYDKVRLEVI